MSHDNVGSKTTMADMNRRNVLLGLGTAAAGSGIVFGSGAFTQVSADRDVNLEIVDDTDADVEINDTALETDNAVIDDGTLEIDVDGANRDAELRIGEGDVDETLDYSTEFDQIGAFKIINGLEPAGDIDLDITLDVDQSNAINEITLHATGEEDPGTTAVDAELTVSPDDGSPGEETLTLNDIEGETQVAIDIKTKDETDDDVGGTLTIQADRTDPTTAE